MFEFCDALKDSELWEMVMEMLPAALQSFGPPALSGMRLGPPGSHNPLMVLFSPVRCNAAILTYSDYCVAADLYMGEQT